MPPACLFCEGILSEAYEVSPRDLLLGSSAGAEEEGRGNGVALHAPGSPAVLLLSIPTELHGEICSGKSREEGSRRLRLGFTGGG